MLLELLPSRLYRSPNVEVLFSDNNSSIFHKVLSENLMEKEIFLSSVAILYVVQGQQIIKNYDGDKVIVEQGQALYLSRDMYVVSDFVTRNSKFEAVIFFFEEEFIERKSRRDTPTKKTNRDIPILSETLQVKKYISSLLDVYRNTDNNKEILDLKLSELIALIRAQQGGETFLTLFDSFSRPKEKRDIQEFMQQNYLKNLNVNDYALLTGRSRSTFMRDFKSLYNTTPNQWLIDRRLEKAYQLLIQNNLNVTETAFEVGYENVSHFIEAYKKKFSVTPKQSKKETVTQISY